MFNVLRARIKQGKRTMAYPEKEPVLPERFRGLPRIAVDACKDCKQCVESCPNGAMLSLGSTVKVDMGKCLFCGECERACKHGAVKFTREYRLARTSREDLVVCESEERKKVVALNDRMRKIFGRSLKLRQVSAGGCNACEADVNVLSTVVFDLGRFGIQFVASPRHADGILVTGPVSKNMKLALIKTFSAIPSPKIVIAVGACAISGGPYAGHDEVAGGVGSILPVDLFIPGCPPHPMTTLDGMLRLLDKIKS